MTTLPLHLESLPETSGVHFIAASELEISLPQPPKRFYRHGWQSWSLTTWLDPIQPPVMSRAMEFLVKDEDPGYAFYRNHVGCWVSAVELGADDILLLGALGLSGRVELQEDDTLHCFYEDRHEGQWIIARGEEDEVFQKYAKALETKFGKGRFERAPRVWCSWYSLLSWVNEGNILKALSGFGDMPFDVFQIDDGWQLAHGDWEANSKFPSGMQSLAEKIAATGRTPGLWLAPFLVSGKSQLAKDHPDWILRDDRGVPISVGMTWSGNMLGLDVTHPEVLAWLDQLIRKVRGWGYRYLKLDFLYIGGLVGKRTRDIPREVAYRNAMQVIRDAAGDAYILACGAPIIPSLGLCDGLRVGPDVAPFWINIPMTVWLSNPDDLCTQNAIRTSIHRLWLAPLVNVDPDVMFFRSKHNAMQPDETQLLQDLGLISGFKATSDLPDWLSKSEMEALRQFLNSSPNIEKQSRYRFAINFRVVNFRRVIPIPASDTNVPVWLAKYLGFLKIAWHQALPAILESIKR